MTDPAPAILYEDARFLAIDKPSGWLVVPGRGAERDTPTVVRHVAAQRGGERLWVVHRLDRETSGVLLLARDAASHRVANRAFARREVQKRYLAVVDGSPSPAAGRVEAPLAPDPRRRRRGCMVVATEGGKPALTAYRVIRVLGEGRAAFVELRPKTGRTHQLRVHLASLGHPVLQDARYGRVDEALPVDRLALHAASLGIPSLALDISAPLPPELEALVASFG